MTEEARDVSSFICSEGQVAFRSPSDPPPLLFPFPKCLPRDIFKLVKKRRQETDLLTRRGQTETRARTKSLARHMRESRNPNSDKSRPQEGWQKLTQERESTHEADASVVGPTLGSSGKHVLVSRGSFGIDVDDAVSFFLGVTSRVTAGFEVLGGEGLFVFFGYGVNGGFDGGAGVGVRRRESRRGDVGVGCHVEGELEGRLGE